MKKIFLFASAAALMLGSCSKDLTEDVAVPSTSGKSKIVASYDVNGANTRTHLENMQYYWDKSDAVGVFDAEAEDDVTNATFQVAAPGLQAIFEGDLDMFAGSKYFVYYPYTPGAELEKGQLTLSINKNQNYSHASAANGVPEGKEGQMPEGSFAQNAAPAVAVGEANEDNRLSVHFSAIASYIVTPIKGFGTVNKIELKIKKPSFADYYSADYYSLAGDFTVAVKDLAVNFNSLSEESIILNCGKGVELNPEVATNFWFVVPADIDMRGATMELYVNGSQTEGGDLSREFAADFRETTKGETGVNRVNWWGKTSDEDFFYDPENHYLIDDANKLLEYVYAATYGYNAIKDLSGFDDSYAADMFEDEGAKLKPAILTKDIDMSTVDTNGVRYDEVDKLSEYVKKVYFLGYQENNNTISRIGGAMDYSINGKYNGKIATIKNLKVEGESLFYDGFGTGQNKKLDTVENIVLENVTVDATGKTKASFLTHRSFPGYMSITLSNITVGADCKLLADEGVDKALVGRAFTSSIAEVENETELKYANELNVYDKDVWFVGENAIDVDYNTITVHSSNAGAILHVADKEAANTLFAAMDENTAWFSLVDADTSYWTGFVADKVTDDDYFTAEELALVVKDRKNGDVAYDITMTNNIDLMGDLQKAWPIVKETAAFTIDGDSKYAISNIYIDGTKVEEQTATKSLNYTTFGSTVNAKNLTLKNVVIDATDAVTPNIAAVSNTPGSKTANVTVDGLTITANAAGTNGIGGLFVTVTKTSATAGTYNYLSGSTIKNVDITGVAEGLAYGDLAGKFTVTVGGVDKLTVSNIATYSNKAFGSIAATISTKQVGETTTYEPAYKSTALDFAGFTTKIMNGDIAWIAQNSSATKQYNLSGFVLFVTNDGAGEWRMIHE